MIKPIILALLLLFSLQSIGQNYFEDFRTHLEAGDTVEQLKTLEKWSENSPNDAELYVSFFNYYFAKSRNEIITLNSQQPDENDGFVLTDPEDNVAGFIGSKIDYDQSNLRKAFESIDEGIVAYPNRLDMRFGKIFVLGEIKHWENFTEEIIETINYSAENDNKWTWTYNEEKSGGMEMFLSSLQNYNNQLFNTMDDKLLKNMQEISRAVLVHYPDHVMSLTNLSIAFLVEKKFDEALVPLLKAEKIEPEDHIVLSNIAYAYKEIGDKKKAKKYYKKVLKYCGDDSQAKEHAERELEGLEK